MDRMARKSYACGICENVNFPSVCTTCVNSRLNERYKLLKQLRQYYDNLHKKLDAKLMAKVVHCDLKPSNVLLDEDMTAHVADFGIAKLMCEDSTDSLSSTLALKGSVGYIAPEYGSNGKVSTKGDVYGYGIILLEMITGKKPTGDMFAGEMNLQRWVRMHYPDRVAEIVDGNLAKNMKDEGMEEDEILERLIPFINVGLMCTRESPYERPTMREVVRALWSMRAEQPSRSPSTLQTLIGGTSTTMNGSNTLDSPNSPRSAAGLV